MENKTGKYFKYAIGEVVLVVIGILIALSINNWNENRKLENNKQNLMQALKQEFQINKKELEERLAGQHKHNSQLNRLVNYSAGSIELPIDSIRHYAANLFYPAKLSMLNSVLEEAISAGKFEMLSDSLKQKISLIKDFTKSRNEINENSSGFIYDNNKENFSFLLKLNTVQELNNEDFYVHPPTTTHPDFVINDEEIVSLIKSSNTYSKLYQIYYFSMIDEVWIKYGLLRLTTETIDILDSELKGE